MMLVSMFNVWVVIMILLVIYSLVDYRNQLYGNIAAAIMASFIGATLAILIYIGAVGTEAGTQVSDTPTAGVILIITIVITIYTFFMVMDAKEEYERQKGDR